MLCLNDTSRASRRRRNSQASVSRSQAARCVKRVTCRCSDDGDASAQGFSSNGNNGACGSNGLAATVVPLMLAITHSPAARWQWGSSHVIESSSTCTTDVRWLPLDASAGTHGADSGATRCWGHASVCVSAHANKRQAPQGGQFTWLRRRCGRRVSFTTLTRWGAGLGLLGR